MVRKYSGKELLNKAEEILKKTKDARIYKRAMAVYLTVGKKLSNEEASTFLGVKPSTVTKYREEFSQSKYEHPKSAQISNRSHLTWEEEESLLETLKQKAETGEFTTIHQIKEEYEKAAGCTAGKSTIYRFLKRHNWRKIVPRPRHLKSDKKTQEEFKKNCRKPCSKSGKKLR